MELGFIGADHEVTGSCHYLNIAGKHILIDCGMEQGEDVYENQELPVNAVEIDFVLLTHAHIDHTGLLPLLYARGFRGKVYTTPATTDLCNIMLRDSAHIQSFEAEWKNRKAKRSGEKEFVPLYEMADAEGALKLFIPCEYDKQISIADGIKVRFTDAGHLLGSASIEIWGTEGDITRKITFSGDIGNINRPLIKNPSYVEQADYVVMESTYGDREHNVSVDYVEELANIINRTFARGGNLVIPSFAVGRTQELLYYLRKIKMDKKVTAADDFEVIVDSPLAVEATNIFQNHIESCFDEEAINLVKQGINPITFPGLKVSVTSDDSKLINSDLKPKVIISASGMCEAGRIRHHLKHNLWRPECTILFVGYQAVGTLGRTLLDGAEEVKLFGETIEVRAEIIKLDGVSGHADKKGLLNWILNFNPKPKKVFVVHGEDNVCEGFAEILKNEYEIDTVAPYTGAKYDLITGDCVQEGTAVPASSKKRKSSRAASIFDRLVAAGHRLLAVIQKNEGGTNKDLAKFTDQINALCDKWDREDETGRVRKSAEVNVKSNNREEKPRWKKSGKKGRKEKQEAKKRGKKRYH